MTRYFTTSSLIYTLHEIVRIPTTGKPIPQAPTSLSPPNRYLPIYVTTILYGCIAVTTSLLPNSPRKFRQLVPELASLFVSRLAFRRHIETSCEVEDAWHIGIESITEVEIFG